MSVVSQCRYVQLFFVSLLNGVCQDYPMPLLFTRKPPSAFLNNDSSISTQPASPTYCLCHQQCFFLFFHLLYCINVFETFLKRFLELNHTPAPLDRREIFKPFLTAKSKIGKLVAFSRIFKNVEKTIWCVFITLRFVPRYWKFTKKVI